MQETRAILFGLVAGSLAVACASQTPPVSAEAPLAAHQAVSPQPFTLETATAAAKADAARKTGVAADSLVVTAATAVTWPDGSMGCPQPGMAYTQALVPGFRIRLRGPAGELDYHASTRGSLLLCPAKRATDPLPGGGPDSRI